MVTAANRWRWLGLLLIMAVWGCAPLPPPYSILSPEPAPPSAGQAAHPGHAVAVQRPPTPGAYRFALVRVGEIDRAPMAFFAHDGQLVMSGITRDQISETPVWTYTPGGRVERASLLPEWCESGAAGYSFGGVIHLAPEAWRGMVVYTAPSPRGPWTKHDFTAWNPHEYKNLKWGLAVLDPDTGRQFLGFGNTHHPGVVLIHDRGWKLFAATPDMRFPTTVSDITQGLNSGSTLISTSTYGQCRLHLVRPEGGVQTLREEPVWGFARVDNAAGLAYLALEDGRVMWSTVSDLVNWRECRYEKFSGAAERIEILGEPQRPPLTGRMLFPTRDSGSGAVGLYEPLWANGELVLRQVAWLEGAGDWAVKLAEVDGQMYLGAGLRTDAPEDRTPGGIFRLEVQPDPGAGPAQDQAAPGRPWAWLAGGR